MERDRPFFWRVNLQDLASALLDFLAGTLASTRGHGVIAIFAANAARWLL